MVQPRRPSDFRRIVRRVKTATAAAELKEYDKLLRGEADCDPGMELTSCERKEKSKRQRRLRFLGNRLFGKAR
jgi:hypothetical protein